MGSPEYYAAEFRPDLEVMGALNDFEKENCMVKTLFLRHYFGICGWDGVVCRGAEVGEQAGSHSNNRGVR